jgi:hypothetical protein
LIIFHGDPEELLLRVRGFVDNFFGCGYCREHFLEAEIQWVWMVWNLRCWENAGKMLGKWN